MEKILSIIIPTYNMEALLRHTLDSLIVPEIKLQKLDVLVINDGSKDSSLAIAQEYEEKYPNIFRAIDKPNGNYGSCINKGLELACGKYVKVLDADDSLDTIYLDEIIGYLTTANVDTVVSDFVIVDQDDNVTDLKTFCLPQNKGFSPGDIEDLDLLHFWHHALIHRTEMLRSINYTQSEGVSYSDDEWVVKPVSVAQSLTYVPVPLYRYLVGREGQTVASSNFAKLCSGKIVVANAILDFYEEIYNNLPESNKDFINRKFSDRCESLYRIFLIRYHTEKSDEALCKFDKKLSIVAPQVYKNLDNVCLNYIKYPFISKWRASGCKDTVLMRLFRFIKKLES